MIRPNVRKKRKLLADFGRVLLRVRLQTAKLELIPANECGWRQTSARLI